MDEIQAGTFTFRERLYYWFFVILLLMSFSSGLGVRADVKISGSKQKFVAINKQIHLTCQYNASPPVSEVQWVKDGSVIARNDSGIGNGLVNITEFTESQSQLLISSSTRNDEGNYTCFVTNVVGNSSDITSVVIQVVPDPPHTLTVDFEGSRVVNISWTAGFEGNSAIENYTVEISQYNQILHGVVCQGSLSSGACVVPSSSTKTSLTGLLPWTTYNIRVFATNAIGKSNSSQILTVTTDEEVPSEAPAFDVIVVNSTAVNVSWQMLSNETARGAILGYYVFYRVKNTTPWSNKTVDGAGATSLLVGSLNEHTTYQFAMQAFNSKGVSNLSALVEETTDQHKPSGPPQLVTLSDVTSKGVKVTWGPVPVNDRNGIIQGYKVNYRALPNGVIVTEFLNISKEIQDEGGTKTLQTLHEFTNYSVSVLAFTIVGDGPPSVAKFVQTLEAKPSAAPMNVSGHNTSSTSIFVTWNDVPAADKNGIITSYNITFHSLTESHSNSTTVDFPANNVTLRGLREFVNYSITVFASTKIGPGPASKRIIVSTGEDKPSAAPLDVKGRNTSSTSILVEWDYVPKPDRNGIITSYNITYHSLTENHSNSIIVDFPGRQVTLIGLKEFVNYSITVSASTKIGPGPASEPIAVITGEDKPSSPPVNVKGQNASSTSILVEWGEVPPADQNGVILTYNVSYQSLTQNNVGSKVVGYPANQTELKGLKKFVNYSITVLASTVKGSGKPSNPIFVITDQDKPTAPPSNVSGHNTSSTSILVRWDNVPPFDQNGIITSYTIKYQSQTEADQGSAVAGPNDRKKELRGLKEYVNYDIRVLASTWKGDGPESNPAIVVRTDQDKPSAPPSNISGHNTSSTSILVQWREVPLADQNGVILTYTISYQSLTQKDNGSKTVDFSKNQTLLTGLKKFVNYSITLFASTVKGNGNRSGPIFVITDQDKPTAAPLKVRGHNTSSTSILVEWDDVPPFDRNGLITRYTITYRSRTENHNGFVKANRSDRRNELTDLREYVNYTITVRASTSKGDGPESNLIDVRTDQDKPSGAPGNLSVINTTSTSIFVMWNEVSPNEQNGIIVSYNVSYRAILENGSAGSFSSELVMAPTRHTNLSGLTKDMHYSVSVLASTIKGDGIYSDPRTFRTNEDRPSGPPQRVQGRFTSSTSIMVNWDVVREDQRHGEIISYTVRYKKLTDGTYKEKKVTSRSDELKRLDKYTVYKIEVLASTRIGNGPPSEPIEERTNQDKPEKPPQSVTVTTVDSSSISVTWEPVPKDFQHGIITEYIILYNYSGEGKISEHKVLGNVRQVVVGGLKQSTEYTIRVLAATVKGRGPASSPKSATTEDPPKPQKPDEGDVGKTEVNIPFVPKQELSDGAPVTKYQVIVMELTDGQDQGKSSDPKYAKVTRKYEDRKAGEPYVTAEFANNKEKRTSFPVGDGKYYSLEGVTDAKRKRREVVEKFLNGKLEDGAKYVAFQRSFDKEGDYESEGFVDFETNKDHTVTIVVVVVIIVIITACIAVGIFVYRRRQSSSRNGEEEMALRPQRRGRTLSQKILGRASGAFDNPAHNPGEAVPVEEFEEHVRRLHANGDLLFSQEYGALKPQAEFTWNATLAQENRHKNRYNNVVAYDHSRVKLSPVQGVPGSDYINANFLDGYQKKRAYIASQGPLPETEDDFWRMIWEQDSKIIVMVTNLEERGRIKCHQYWPSEGGKAYGDIQVTLMQIVELSDFTIRTFTLKKANSRSERTLHQYHYTVWPDHGVPSCPTSLLTFVKKASGANPADAGPMVVHCSAGVGRTGTFIVVDAMLQSIAAEKTVDVFGYVMTLRRDRNIMVQVEEQYVFIHEVLLEAIHSGYTEIRANDLRSHMKLLMQVSPSTGQTEMDEEFIRLGRGNTPQTKFQAANMGYNKTKNRYANVLAFDDTRVKLSMITGIEGSDYINANFIDGYMTRRAFIATQAPIPDTIPDFWRMIWEQESSTIVMLSKETESGKVKVHRYWPAKQPANIGTLVVEMTNEMVYEDYTMREIKLTNTKESASRVVRQYHYTGWPDVGSPESGTGLIDLIGQVQRWQQNSGNTTITVHCSAGVGRTGVFCALSILIERLKSEGVVDVFQTVKQLRAQRPAMVQTKDQYEFIYSALSEYLDSFDAYSNFE